jgi:chromosomal replication initiation ATPase DnaA
MVKSKSRRIEYVKARMMFSYIACKDYNISQTDVARVMDKERSTLVHYNSKIQGFLDIDDPETKRDVKNIREMLIK